MNACALRRSHAATPPPPVARRVNPSRLGRSGARVPVPVSVRRDGANPPDPQHRRHRDSGAARVERGPVAAPLDQAQATGAVHGAAATAFYDRTIGHAALRVDHIADQRKGRPIGVRQAQIVRGFWINPSQKTRYPPQRTRLARRSLVGWPSLSKAGLYRARCNMTAHACRSSLSTPLDRTTRQSCALPSIPTRQMIVVAPLSRANPAG